MTGDRTRGEIWTVLIVEDRAEERAELRKTLLAGVDRPCRVLEADCGKESLGLARGRVDCILLSEPLPDLDAADLLTDLRGDGLMTSCPAIVLTDRGMAVSAEVLRAGAMDCLGRAGLTSESLALAISNATERFALQKELLGIGGPRPSLRDLAPERRGPDGEGRASAGPGPGVGTETALRKSVDVELRESRERLRLALRAGAMGTFVWHVAEDRSEPDERMLELFDLPPQSSLSLAIAMSRLIHPDDRAAHASSVAHAIDPQGPGALREEFRVLLPDGSIRWLSVNGQTEFSEEPRRALRMIGTAVDVTDRKRDEARLRANDARHAFLLKLSDALRPLDDAEAILDAAASLLGRQLRASRVGYAEDLGDGEWAIVRRSYADGVSAVAGRFRYADYGTESLRELIAGRTLIRNDITNDPGVSAQERSAYARLGLGAMVNLPLVKAGRLVAILFVHQRDPRSWTPDELWLMAETADRTWAAVQRVRAESHLRTNALRLRFALEAARAGTWEYVPAYETFLASDLARSLHGLPAGGPVTEDQFLAAIHPDDRELVRSAVEETLRQGSPFRVELRVPSPDGAIRWLASHAELKTEGDQQKLVGLVQDITDRKRSESHLALLAELSQAFAPVAGADEIARTAAVTICRHLGVSRCLLVEIDEEGEIARVFLDHSEVELPSLVGDYRISDFHPEAERRRLASGQPILIDNVRGAERTPDASARFEALGVASIANAPYISGGRWRFVLSVMQTTPRKWEPDEAELLRELAARTYLRLERARDEQWLRASHATFRHLVENSPFGVYVIDADFRLVQVSAGARGVFANIKPLIGRDFAEVMKFLWPEPFASAAIGQFRQTLETGVPYSSTSTVERRNDTGEVESYDWKIEQLTLPDGRPGVVCHFYDLSERERYEAAVRESDARFRRAIDASGVLVYERDLPGDQPARTYGLDHIIGDDGKSFELTWSAWSARIHPDDQLAYRASLEACVENLDCTAYQAEYRVRHTDGSWRDVIDQAQVRRDADGDPRQVVGTILDITERRRAEQALKEADRRKDEFLAMLGHELRNPLAPIRNAVQLLRMTESRTPTVGRALDVIDRQVGHIIRLVDDLLDVARVSSGKIQLHKEPIDLRAAVRQAVEMSRPTIDARKHLLSVRFPEVPVPVEADFTRITQVIANLLNNAAKYTDRGGRVALSVESEGAEAVVRVSDNGRGIEPAALRNLFDLFYQVDRNIDRSEGGLGIGLSLVKRLVSLHGGTVEAQSPGRGEGSQFVVRLPLIQEIPLPATPREESEVPQRLQVLVVDDNVDSAESLALLLQIEGHEVRVAHDGLKAVEIALAERPDVVILDIGLPHMDGFEACREMRERGLGDALIVAMSGYAQDEDRQRSLSSGFDLHLVKPVQLATLRQIVSQQTPRA